MKGLKQKRNMTTIELANAIGIKQGSISMYENGKRFPRKEVLNKLCEFFDCKVDDLL